jgi:hypothetical protein
MKFEMTIWRDGYNYSSGYSNLLHSVWPFNLLFNTIILRAILDSSLKGHFYSKALM